MEVEEYFPRGGTLKTAQNKSFTNHTDFVFDSNKRKRTDLENDGGIKKLRVKDANNFIPDINYAIIDEGLMLLACIRSITTFSIEVELPGKMCGKIKITSISDPLTKFLEREASNGQLNSNKDSIQLNKIFNIGQFIPSIVTSKDSTEKGVQLTLSMNPSDIHRTWSYDRFKKGCVIWAAVKEKQDHGYQLSVGNDNCRIFLPSKNIQDEINYEIGQPLWCTIKKVSLALDIVTIVVSTLHKHMKVREDMEFGNLIPGAPVNFTVSKVLARGLLGTFLTGNKGCVQEVFLKTPLQDCSEYENADNLKAVVLYVHPGTKLTYFSLRSTSPSLPKYRNNSILNAQVVKRRSGLYVNLPDGVLGFVPFKRIVNNIEDYPIDSQHKCRILDYRHLEQMYICTFDTFIVEKKSDNDIQDLKIGQVVNAQVIAVQSKGIVVKIGKLKGFIYNIHLVDEVYSETVKSRFKVGDVLRSKVWNIKGTDVYLTCKQLLISTATEMENVMVNKQYAGVIVKKTLKGMLVIFSGDRRGMVLKAHVDEVFGSESYDLFYEGEVIMPIVTKIQNDDLVLKFQIPKIPKISYKLKVGEYVNGVVTKIDVNGLYIDVHKKNISGFVPVPHLSSSLTLTPLLLNTYKVGDYLEDLMCVCTDQTPILSIRESKEFKLKNSNIPTLDELTVGSVIRCSHVKSQSMRVRVSALLAPKTQMLNLYSSDLDHGLNQKFVYQQAIIAKVTRINRERKLIKITAISKDVFDWTYEETVNNLKQYMHDVLYIQEHNSTLAQYSIGQHVNCTIKKVREDQSVVKLENGANGIVLKEHFIENMKAGDKVNGIILWVDIHKNSLIISLQTDLINCLNTIEADIEIGTCINSSILHSGNDITIAMSENNHMIFLPVMCNKKFLPLRPYTHMQKINVIIKGVVNRNMIGIDKLLLTKTEEPKASELVGTIEQKQTEIKINKSQNENSFKYNPRLLPDVESATPSLPGVEDFFNSTPYEKSNSSSDDDAPLEKKPKKKKKLTAAERTESIRQTEEKIRAKEIELADSTLEPQSEQHFERLVMGNPNSSELWGKYIAYCVSNAEIHKARSIAKSALKRIDMKETEERYNVWIMLLNLENSYGDKDSFNSAFEEAVRCNDDLQIYLDVIHLLADSEKFVEMNEKIKKVKSKHKGDPKMWASIARAYYKCGHIQEARNVHNGALKSIEMKTNRTDLVVQFAIMEFNYGEKHHAEALFETILQSNPKRVDIWSSYVDQVIKKDNIDSARRILERAVSQNIPPKKIKILFKKFKELELKFGNEAGVQHVIDLAKQYLGEKDE